MRGKIRTDALPGHAAIARAMQILRAVVDDMRVVRRNLHRRDPLEAVNEIASGIAVERLRANPVALFIRRVEIEPAELTLATSIHNIGIALARNDRQIG